MKFEGEAIAILPELGIEEPSEEQVAYLCRVLSRFYNAGYQDGWDQGVEEGKARLV